MLQGCAAVLAFISKSKRVLVTPVNTSLDNIKSCFVSNPKRSQGVLSNLIEGVARPVLLFWQSSNCESGACFK